jgi:hypothetical protein
MAKKPVESQSVVDLAGKRVCANCEFIDDVEDGFGFCRGSPPQVVLMEEEPTSCDPAVSVLRPACRFFSMRLNS